MFIFKNVPGTPVDYKGVVWRLVLAALAFWVIMFFLIPFLGDAGIEKIARVIVTVVAILFLVDMFL